MKIKNFLFSPTVFCLTVLSFVVVSCQKDNVDPDLLKSSGRSAQSTISVDKQDRQILFISKRDAVTTDEIYAMNADGLNIVRLTNNTIADGRATWSANGQHLAFASGVTGSRDIFIMN